MLGIKLGLIGWDFILQTTMQYIYYQLYYVLTAFHHFACHQKFTQNILFSP